MLALYQHLSALTGKARMIIPSAQYITGMLL